MNDVTARRVKSERPGPGRFDFARWAYLVFFVFILTGPLFSPNAGVEDWIFAVGVIAVALPTYVISELRGWYVGGAVLLMVMALATAPLDSSAIMVLPIYSAALLAMSASRQTLRFRLAVVSVLTLTGFFLSTIPWPYRIFILVPIVMTWIIGYSVFNDLARDHRASALTAENRRIAHLATIAERERIARDVHDLAGHSLTAIIVRSQLVERLTSTDPVRAAEEAGAIEGMAREALSSIRESVVGWHQASLVDERSVAEDALAAAGIQLEAVGDWDVDLAPSVENVLALGLREAITNVVRHANATNVAISIDDHDGGASLTVADDGVGPTNGAGSGIQGMRERVIAAGGVLSFGPGVAGGTELRIDMPFGGTAT